eukprot:m.181934 g.181934  ORF g.181934 m.181934 type:complete len:90 (+) comp32088_c1_seq1:382-651(+)
MLRIAFLGDRNLQRGSAHDNCGVHCHLDSVTVQSNIKQRIVINIIIGIHLEFTFCVPFAGLIVLSLVVVLCLFVGPQIEIENKIVSVRY